MTQDKINNAVEITERVMEWIQVETGQEDHKLIFKGYDYADAWSELKKLKSLLQSDNEGREKLIEEIEFLRQGFRSASDNSRDKVFKMSMEAYHKNADRIIIQLGGESVRSDNQEIDR